MLHCQQYCLYDHILFVLMYYQVRFVRTICDKIHSYIKRNIVHEWGEYVCDYAKNVFVFPAYGDDVASPFCVVSMPHSVLESHLVCTLGTKVLS
jgi:hypothetical protein